MDEEKTEWVPTKLKKQVQAIRETNVFKKVSEQNEKNKATGPKARNSPHIRVNLIFSMGEENGGII